MCGDAGQGYNVPAGEQLRPVPSRATEADRGPALRERGGIAGRDDVQAGIKLPTGTGRAAPRGRSQDAHRGQERCIRVAPPRSATQAPRFSGVCGLCSSLSRCTDDRTCGRPAAAAGHLLAVHSVSRGCWGWPTRRFHRRWSEWCSLPGRLVGERALPKAKCRLRAGAVERPRSRCPHPLALAARSTESKMAGEAASGCMGCRSAPAAPLRRQSLPRVPRRVLNRRKTHFVFSLFLPCRVIIERWNTCVCMEQRGGADDGPEVPINTGDGGGNGRDKGSGVAVWADQGCDGRDLLDRRASFSKASRRAQAKRPRRWLALRPSRAEQRWHQRRPGGRPPFDAAGCDARFQAHRLKQASGDPKPACRHALAVIVVASQPTQFSVSVVPASCSGV